MSDSETEAVLLALEARPCMTLHTAELVTEGTTKHP